MELGKRILPRNALTKESDTPRLLLRKKDQSFFRRHVLEAQPILSTGREALDAPQQRIAENLDEVDDFCRNRSEDTLSSFANYILTMVYVVFVNTDSWKSAYRLFNVLNARGLSLSNADLIKNTLFSQLGSSQANRSSELENRWLELEEELGADRLDIFFGHHRTSIKASKARGSLHEEFDPIIRKTDGGPFAFLDTAIDSAENYMKIVDAGVTESSTLRSLQSLQRVDTMSGFPHC